MTRPHLDLVKILDLVHLDKVTAKGGDFVYKLSLDGFVWTLSIL